MHCCAVRFGLAGTQQAAVRSQLNGTRVRQAGFSLVKLSWGIGPCKLLISSSEPVGVPTTAATDSVPTTGHPLPRWAGPEGSAINPGPLVPVGASGCLAAARLARATAAISETHLDDATAGSRRYLGAGGGFGQPPGATASAIAERLSVI